MKVWIVTVGVCYEGEETVGIYSTKDKAEEARERLRGRKYGAGDFQNITELEIDEDYF